MADEITNNYVVGRGRLFFGQFKTGTRRANGQLYFGNTPELSLAQDEDTLDHYSSEGGVRVKDASVTLQNDSSGTFACDNISDENLALWFRGIVLQHIEAGSGSATGTITFANAVPAANDYVTINGQRITFVAANPVGMQVVIGATIAATAANLVNFIAENPPLGVTASANAAVVTLKAKLAGTGGNAITIAKQAVTAANIVVSGPNLAGGVDATETITNVSRGRWYQLGRTDSTPQGVRNVGSIKIAGVADDSFVTEAETGRFYINSDADDVIEGGQIEVSYGITGGVEDIVIARGEKIEGELQFIANNAAGDNKDFFWPYVRLTPDGDFSLKGDDWQTMNFNFEILKRDAIIERQYITTRRAAA